MKYAVLSTQDGPRYGRIISIHRTAEAAYAAEAKIFSKVLKQYPDALVYIMYEVRQLPTPAGATGKAGDRIAIDLSR